MQNTIALDLNPKEYFRAELHKASQNLKISLGEDLEFYMVNLLCDFISLKNFNEPVGQEENIFDAPLTQILQKAIDEKKPEQKIKTLKYLGDTSLYVAGYFQDYFNRKTYDIKYYIDMGSSAYQSVGTILESQSNNTKRDVFANLSENFVNLVDLVAEISHFNDAASNQNILAIYDRWNRCNSGRLRKILEESGIIPIPIPLKRAQ
jgi:hypothetical protein